MAAALAPASSPFSVRRSTTLSTWLKETNTKMRMRLARIRKSLTLVEGVTLHSTEAPATPRKRIHTGTVGDIRRTPRRAETSCITSPTPRTNPMREDNDP